MSRTTAPIRARVALVSLALLLTSSLAASAPVEEREVTGARIELGELVPSAPDIMRSIDVGPAPAPGSSRLFSRDTIVRQVSAAGFDASSLELRSSVRARRRGTTHSAESLQQLLTAPVEAALPSGVTLLNLTVSSSLTLEEFEIATINIPKLPKRAGALRIALAIEFKNGNAPGVRLPVTAVVSQTEEALRSTVSRGQRIQLVIQHGAVRIAADSVALADGDVGDELRFRVLRTGKILLGKVASSTSAVVQELR